MSYIYERKNTGDLFHDLKKMDRNNFSYEGAKALMEYIEQIAEDTGEPIEYDPIALCCDYAEYADLADYNKQTGGEYESLDDLEHEITVIRLGGNYESFIAQGI